MSEERTSNFFPVNSAAVVALLTGFFLVVPASDESNSPNVPANSSAALPENGNDNPRTLSQTVLHAPTFANVRTVPSGLWNDPFEGRNAGVEDLTPDPPAQETVNEQLPNSGTDFDELREFLKKRTGETSGNRLVVMPVMVEGDNSSSRVASRVNARHAVEHAMATVGYQMEFGNRMSFARPVWRVKFGEKWRSYRADVPIKFYSPQKSTAEESGPPVLVCWIDGQYLGQCPVYAIVSMLKDLLGEPLLKTSDIRLIGPNYSSELNRIGEEFGLDKVPVLKGLGFNELEISAGDDNCRIKMSDLCGSFQIFSPSATRPSKEFLELEENNSGEMSLYSSTIAPDVMVEQKMLQEMEFRRRQHGRVVIVAESGGLSPQGMASGLSNALKENYGISSVQLSYLKQLSAEANASPSGSSSNSSSGPSGTDDYFQRQLSELTQSGDAFRGDDVSAVFVLGDDVWDKLAVIRNLRRIFTNATFFTHDLNHQYFDRKNLEFTRGLIVVSRGYLTGHCLHSDDQAKVLESQSPGVVFRDVYQKTRYMAVLKAIGGKPYIRKEQVTVFEMGFNGPNELETPVSAGRFLRWLSMLLCLLTAVGTIAGLILLNRTESLWQEAGKGWQRLLYELKTLLRVMSPAERLQEGPVTGESGDSGESSGGQKARRVKQSAELPARTEDVVSLWWHCRKEYQGRLTEIRRRHGVLFGQLYGLRAELAIAAIAGLFVWRVHMESDSLQAALSITFVGTAVVLIYLSLLPALSALTQSVRPPLQLKADPGNQSSKESAEPDLSSLSDRELIEKVVRELDSRKQDRSPGTSSDGILARMLFYGFLFLLLMFVVRDIASGTPLLQEPLAVFSGISNWPVLAGLSVVIVLAMRWLSTTWSAPLRASGGRCSSMLPPSAVPACADLLSGRLLLTFHDVAPFVIHLLRRHIENKAALPGAAAPETRESKGCGRKLIHDWATTVSRFSVVRLITIARLSMISLIVMYCCYHLASGNGAWLTWALLPLPPARGTIVLAAASFLGILGLLLTLLVSLTGLIQVCLLLSLVGGLEKRWREYIESRTATDHPFPEPVSARACSACDFLQQSSASTIRHALQNPALLLLAYALCRFPLIESWTVNSNSVILIAGIPTLLTLGTAVLLRLQCNRFRSMIIRTLEQEEYIAEQSKPAVDQSTPAADTAASLKNSRTRIAAMTQGAFGSIWSDPILGSFLFFTTAISSSQKIDPIRFITAFLFGV